MGDRPRYDAVDDQIEEFEEHLRAQLEVNLIIHMNRDFWLEMDNLSHDDRRTIHEAINYAFQPIVERYEHIKSVRCILNHARLLFSSIVWSAMNVPYPRNVTTHIDGVIDNAFQIYTEVIYPHLRTEMIMANHYIEVIQRKWRECYYVPYHPVCKRRLLRDFEEFGKDLSALQCK
jgi:hypothetical protein